MFKTIKKAQSGFTIIELLIVIAIIVALAMLVLNNFQGAQAKARDTQRVADINNIHSKLEEFYNDNSYYPDTLDIDASGTIDDNDFPGIDGNSLTDPTGNNVITVNAAVATEAAAITAAAPAGDTSSTSSYVYVPYPTGCADNCTGYVLGTYIERESTTTPNPYTKKGLNNE